MKPSLGWRKGERFLRVKSEAVFEIVGASDTFRTVECWEVGTTHFEPDFMAMLDLDEAAGLIVRLEPNPAS